MRTFRCVSWVVMGLLLTVLVGFSPFGLRSVEAAAIELKLAHVDAPDIWTSRKGGGATLFKQIVEMETGGAVDVKVFPAGQLGGERELTEAVKLGTVQMTMVSGAVANVFKEYQILDIPYLFFRPRGMESDGRLVR